MAIRQIYQWARQQPEKTAFIYNGVAINYATFWRMIAATRCFFAEQRLPVGHTAAVFIHSIAETWIITLALRALGLNAVSLQSAEQARSLIVNDLACVVINRPLNGLHPTPQYSDVPIVMVPMSIYADCDKGDVGDLLYEEQQYPFGGQILLTSATTGIYKKVLMDGKFEEKRNAARAATWSLDRNTLLHGMDFPPWTGAGFKQPSAVWHAGGCIVFDQRAEQFERFFAYDITQSLMVESMLRPVLETQQAQEQSQRQFDLVFIGGFLSQGLAEKATRRLTRNMAIHYACTELATYALYSSYQTRDDLFWMRPNNERVVQVVNEQGVECPIDIEGELRILLTDIDGTGYLGDEEASAKYFRDGWFYPGDMAVARDDGRIRILGRCSDVLNVQGHKLAVAPMEMLVKQHLGLEDVCLFSGMNDNGEAELVIAIQGEKVPAKSVVEALHPNFKRFEKLRIEMFDAFPRSESGMRKIQRSVLRSLVFSGK